MAAQVSGPGALSQRTDTGGQPIRSLPDPDYGDAQDFRNQQKGAPLGASGTPQAPPPGSYPSDIASAAQGPAPTAGAGAPAPAPGPQAPLPGLFDQGHPDIPMTAGAPMGAGPNALPGQSATTLRDQMAKYTAADPTGTLASLANSLSERGW